MPKPRLPASTLALRGTYSDHRGRQRPPEPQGAGDIGEPPDDLPDAHKRAWRDLVSAAPAGVLTASDRPFLRYCAGLYARVLSGDDLPVTIGGRFEAAMGRLGMTPADRARVAVAPPEPMADPASRFFD